MQIIIHGSIGFDHIKTFPGFFKDHIVADKIHQINTTFELSHVRKKRGGPGGNIAYNLALLGEEPILVASVGDDAEEYIHYLERLGVQTKGISVHAGLRSSMADLITDKANNQIGGFYVGAAGESVDFSLSQMLHPEQCILILSPSNNNPDTMRLIREAKEFGTKYIFDPGQTTANFTPEELQEAIAGAFMLIVNDYEHELIKKRTGYSQEDILQHVNILIQTLGKSGSVIYRKGVQQHIPICREFDLVDPTGAGDAYRAGLLKGIVEHLSVEHAGLIAATTAAFVISEHGTQEHVFTHEDFKRAFERNFGVQTPIYF